MKFNDTKQSVEERTKTENYEGGTSYEPDTPELGLAKNTINNLLEDEYYESDSESLSQLRTAFQEAADENPEFPLQLAAYARQEMYLRDVSQVLLVLSAHHDESKKYVEKWAATIIDRADEPSTVTAIHDQLFGGTMPKPLKKGINRALHKFDKYQYDKYDNDNREVNIRDVINRTHPNPQDDLRDEIFERLMRGNLDNYPDVEPLDESQGKTWETKLSESVKEAIPEDWQEAKKEAKAQLLAEQEPELVRRQVDNATVGAGWRNSSGGLPEQQVRQTWELETPSVAEQDIEERAAEISEYSKEQVETLKEEAKREAWREVLDDMGLFALIRNIRNMKEAGLSSEEIVEGMSTDWIENAQIYPFRFYQSYNAVKNAGVSDPIIEDELSAAIDASADSLDDNLTDTFVAVDTSGSMYGRGISNDSDLERVEIGALFGAMMMRHGADTGAFGEEYKRVTAHHRTPTLELQQKIMDAQTGASTNAHKAIHDIRRKGESYDRVVIFTDEQLWDSTSRGWGGYDGDQLKDAWERYKDEVNQSASLYIVDLASYGDMSFPEGYPDVYQLQGWTSDMLDYIQHAENEDVLLRDIKNFEPYTPEAFR